MHTLSPRYSCSRPLHGTVTHAPHPRQSPVARRFAQHGAAAQKCTGRRAREDQVAALTEASDMEQLRPEGRGTHTPPRAHRLQGRRFTRCCRPRRARPGPVTGPWGEGGETEFFANYAKLNRSKGWRCLLLRLPMQALDSRLKLPQGRIASAPQTTPHNPPRCTVAANTATAFCPVCATRLQRCLCSARAPARCGPRAKGRSQPPRKSVNHAAAGLLGPVPRRGQLRGPGQHCWQSPGRSRARCRPVPLLRGARCSMWGRQPPGCAGHAAVCACCCTEPHLRVRRRWAPTGHALLTAPLPLAARPAPGGLSRDREMRHRMDWSPESSCPR